MLIVVSLAGSAAAQSPRAGGPAPGDDPTPRIALDAALAGNLARGFVDREMVAARGILQGWTGPWGLYIQPYWLYGRVGTPAGKITTDNEIYVRTGVFRQLEGGPLFLYLVDAYDRSLRRKIDYRNLLGGGAGVNLYRDKTTSLLTSVGILGEVADFKLRRLENPDGAEPIELDGRRYTLRWSVRVYGRYKLAGGKLALTHDLIVIPSFNDPRDDYRVLFLGAIDAPIAKGFSARVQADATYEGLIVLGTKHGDLAVTFGISYRNEWAAKSPPASSPPPR